LKNRSDTDGLAKGFWCLVRVDKGFVCPLADFHNLKTGPAILRKEKGSEREFIFINRSPYPKNLLIILENFVRENKN
jgi:hypothetical protein